MAAYKRIRKPPDVIYSHAGSVPIPPCAGGNLGGGASLFLGAPLRSVPTSARRTRALSKIGTDQICFTLP
jgi:hypothetical protein